MRVVLVAVLLWSSVAWGQTVVETKIESVGLFKNGLAVVERSVDLAAGSYRIEDVPTPVHGTFFIESASPVTARVTMMLVDSPLDLNGAPLQDQLAGRQVDVTLREKEGVLSGKVAAMEPAEKVWNRQYEQPRHYYLDGWGRPMPQPGGGRFIVLETADGSVLVDQSMIASIKITGEAKTAKKRKPVLILTLPDGSPKQKVRISYLSAGLAWAPSYRVELTDDKNLTIVQNAIVKNELMNLKDVEVFLISGYPSIEFSNVASPLSLQQGWSAFFQQLNSPRRGPEGAGVAMRQAVMFNRADDATGPAVVAPPDESIDVHYESIGKKTLDEGDALAIDVADGTAEYERVVEWVIPDTRQPDGRYIDEYARRQDPDRFDDSPWDAVKFKNPLPFAMTTAPATFTRGGKFLGQQLSRWVNRGEETTLRITKALSIRTRAAEYEEPNNDRQVVNIGGRSFRQVSARGELVIRNYRKTDATVVIKRQFSGELNSADGQPEVTLREEGIWSVNKRNEMKWTLPLKAGEEKTLKYTYTVLVAH